MKKILALIMAVAMVATSAAMILPSSAADAEAFKDVILAPDKGQDTPAFADGLSTVDYGNGKKVTWTATEENPKEGLDIKGYEDWWRSCKWTQISTGTAPTFEFTVPAAGKYNVKVAYASSTPADTAVRAADYIVNGGDPVKLDVTQTIADGWNVRNVIDLGSIELKEGVNTIQFVAPKPASTKTDDNGNVINLDADGKEIKNINIIEVAVSNGVEAKKSELAHYTFNSCALEDGLTAKGDGEVVLKDGKVSFVNTPGTEDVPGKYAWLESDVDFTGLDAVSVVVKFETTAPLTNTNWLFDLSTESIHNPGPHYFGCHIKASGQILAETLPGAWPAWNNLNYDTNEEERAVGTSITVVTAYDAEGYYKLYVNGVLTHAEEVTRMTNGEIDTPIANVLGNNPVLKIGKANWGDLGEYADSIAIDEVIVYNYALTADEAAAVKTETNPTGDMHKISEDWSSDETTHYHACEVCGKKFDVADHESDGNTDGTKDTLCKVCNYVITPKKEDAHKVENWKVDEKTGEHVGTCSVCGTTVKHAAEMKHKTEGDCTSDLVCQVEGCTITEKGEPEHKWSEKGTDNKDGTETTPNTHTLTCTNEGCTQTKKEECKSSNTDCTLASLCDKCGHELKKAGEHIIKEWTASKDGTTHTGVCTSCKKEFTHEAKAAADDGDCSTAVKCVGAEGQKCDYVMVEAKTHTADKTKAPTSDGKGHHTYPCANEGCTKTVEEECKSVEELPCDQAEKCVCGYETKPAGEHKVTEWKLDEKTGMHVGTCTVCKETVSHAPIPDDRTDCTEDVVCKTCGLSIVKGCAGHSWSEWKDDGKGNHERHCLNEYCTGTESVAHTYTDEMNVCPVCGAKNPNYKAPASSDPADTKPADTKPADTKPAETKPADTKPADTKPAEPGVSGGDGEGGKGPSVPQTGDSGIAIFAALAVVSAASIAVTVALPGKKRH